MESTGFHEPLYDFIEPGGFSVILANPLRNDWIPESYVPPKDIKEIRRVGRMRIRIKLSIRSYRNRTGYELLRLHVDYEVYLSTLRKAVCSWSAPHPDSSCLNSWDLFDLFSMVSSFFPNKVLNVCSCTNARFLASMLYIITASFLVGAISDLFLPILFFSFLWAFLNVW